MIDSTIEVDGVTYYFARGSWCKLLPKGLSRASDELEPVWLPHEIEAIEAALAERVKL